MILCTSQLPLAPEDLLATIISAQAAGLLNSKQKPTSSQTHVNLNLLFLLTPLWLLPRSPVPKRSPFGVPLSIVV